MATNVGRNQMPKICGPGPGYFLGLSNCHPGLRGRLVFLNVIVLRHVYDGGFPTALLGRRKAQTGCIGLHSCNHMRNVFGQLNPEIFCPCPDIVPAYSSSKTLVLQLLGH